MGLARAVESAIRAASEPLTLRQSSGGTYDATTRSITGASTTETSTIGVVTAFSAMEANGVSIELGDLKAEIPAASLTDSSIAPAVGDHVTRDSTLYRVVGVETRRMGSETVAWRLHLRGVK